MFTVRAVGNIYSNMLSRVHGKAEGLKDDPSGNRIRTPG